MSPDIQRCEKQVHENAQDAIYDDGDHISAVLI